MTHALVRVYDDGARPPRRVRRRRPPRARPDVATPAGSRSWRPRRCRCSGSSSPRSGSSPGCTTGTSTRARRASGNIVNCGAAMYMAPVGLVNAANPAAAYAEALDVAGAHQSSYGREAAGVFAAAVAAACVPGATPDLGRRRRRSPWPRTAPARRSRRCAKWPPAHGLRVRAGAAAGGRRALRHRRARTTATPPSAPAGPPGCTPSRNCRSRSACCSSAAATTGARCSARSTTAATATPSPR